MQRAPWRTFCSCWMRLVDSERLASAGISAATSAVAVSSLPRSKIWLARACTWLLPPVSLLGTLRPTDLSRRLKSVHGTQVGGSERAERATGVGKGVEEGQLSDEA